MADISQVKKEYEIQDQAIINIEVANQPEEKFTKSLIFNYFTIKQIVNKKLIAVCNACFKKISGTLNVTSNFVKHLQRKHPNLMKQYKNLDNRKTPVRANNQTQFLSKSLDNFIIDLVIENMLPLSFVESPNCISNNCQIMSQKTIGRRIDIAFEQNKLKIKENLEKAEYICTTCDIWSTRTRSFFGITAHWIDNNFERKEHALACRVFSSPHNYKNILQILEDTYNSFNIFDKIVGTVSDNGSNFVNSFKTFGVQIYVNNLDNGEEYFDEDEVKFITINENELSHVLPFHLRCASHILSLIMTTDISSLFLNVNTQLGKLYKNLILKSNILWKMAQTPKFAEEMVRILGHVLKVPVVTRWNSLYDSLKDILTHKSKLNELFDLTEDNGFQCVDYQFLEELLSVMEPIAIALDKFQDNKFSYYGYLIPILRETRSKLMDHKLKLKFCDDLLNVIIENLESRFFDFFTFTNNANFALLATMSHPFFKLDWLDDSQHKDYLKKLLLSESRMMKIISTSKDILYQPLSEYFRFKSKPTGIILDPMGEIELEVLNYLKNENEDLNMLNDFPTIKQIFFKYNMLLCSSAPVERMFSLTTQLHKYNQSRLNNQLFEKLIILKNNL